MYGYLLRGQPSQKGLINDEPVNSANTITIVAVNNKHDQTTF